MLKSLTATLAIALAFTLTSCNTMHDDKHHAKNASMHNIDAAIAIMHPTHLNTAKGTVTFQQVGDKVRVQAHLTGLTANTTHGFHIHEYGDCSAPDATSAGGHYNPEGHDHALPQDAHRHAGDLGNISSDAKGNATLDITVSNITINGKTNPILGRGLIVHAAPDDGGQPTGNAGPRIACGVIGVAHPGN